MKIYRVTISDDDPECGLLAISLVDFPAVERNFIKFKGESERPRRVSLKADEEQRVITGIALLADTPIYRFDPEIGEYYIVFEKDTIRQLVQKYSRDGLLNVINLQHDSDTYSVDSCVMVESYFTDKARGIAPAEFADVPDGSWVVSFKVTDPELWEAIKASHGEEGGLNGFSVEVVSGFEQKYRMEPETAETGEIATFEEAAEELLAGFKKKSDLRISRSDIKDVMGKRRQIEVEVDGKTYTGQIKDLGKLNGEDAVSFYDVKTDRWRVLPLYDIARVRVLDTPMAPWNYNLPSYNDIEGDDDFIVTNSIIANREAIEACIERQYFAMITYDDESEHPARGQRQVQIVCYGTSLRGNECFRAYEYHGDTATSLPGGVGNWRLFLTKRCTSFKILNWMEKWATLPPGYHTGDVDMTTIYKEVNPAFINK